MFVGLLDELKYLKEKMKKYVNIIWVIIKRLKWIILIGILLYLWTEFLEKYK